MLTRFPIRRCGLKVGVAYTEDINPVREALERAADKPLSLDEPLPLFMGFGESALAIQLSVQAGKSANCAPRCSRV